MSIEVTDAAIDACTLNNVMNAAQIAVLIMLLRWVRTPCERCAERDRITHS